MGNISRIESPALLVMDIIVYFLHTVQSGYLSLTVQDGVVIHVESVEKFILNAKNRNNAYIKNNKPLTKHPFQDAVLAELKGIRYGQLIIRLADGQIDKF